MTTEDYFALALRDCERYEAACRSASGTDRSEGELFRLRAAYWRRLGLGESHAASFATFDHEWRTYAANVKARVDAAPPIRRGPSRGTSSLSYLWVSPDKAQASLPYLMGMQRPRVASVAS